MSFAAIAGALIGAGSSSAQSSGWLNYSSAKSLNKKTAQQNAAISLAAAQELALHQPSWEMQGLRDAGLNPVLAAQHLGSSSLPSVNGSVGSAGGGTIDNPVSTALSIRNSEKQIDNLDKQNALLTAQKGQVEADTLKALSDANVNSARVHNINQDTLNKKNTRGLSGPFSAANQVGQDAEYLSGRAFDSIKSGLSKSWKYIKSLGSRLSNSAKDYSSGIKKVSPSKSSSQHIKDEILYRH